MSLALSLECYPNKFVTGQAVDDGAGGFGVSVAKYRWGSAV